MIAREGIPFTVAGAVVTLVVLIIALRIDSWWLFAAGSLLALLTLFVTFFFRDPHRTPADTSESTIIAPADGQVINIERVDHHPYIGGPCNRVSIFLSLFDVHINRMPAAATVEYVDYHPGSFHKAFTDEASRYNEHTEIGMITDRGERLVLKQIAGILARRISCRLVAGLSGGREVRNDSFWFSHRTASARAASARRSDR